VEPGSIESIHPSTVFRGGYRQNRSGAIRHKRPHPIRCEAVLFAKRREPARLDFHRAGRFRCRPHVSGNVRGQRVNLAVDESLGASQHPEGRRAAARQPPHDSSTGAGPNGPTRSGRPRRHIQAFQLSCFTVDLLNATPAHFVLIPHQCQTILRSGPNLAAVVQQQRPHILGPSSNSDVLDCAVVADHIDAAAVATQSLWPASSTTSLTGIRFSSDEGARNGWRRNRWPLSISNSPPSVHQSGD
jgi:hypothetical protein